jgi:hypothetical protein
MQTHSLRAPSDYLPDLKNLRERNKYAKSCKLRVERKTNRHTTTGGHCWGWYEVSPLGKEVGFWNNETRRDDLKDVDVAAWNAEAERLSA